MEDVAISTDMLLEGYAPDMELSALILSLLDKMDLLTLSEKSEVDEEVLRKYLALEGNPTLSDIKRIARVAGKKVNLSFADSRSQV